MTEYINNKGFYIINPLLSLFRQNLTSDFTIMMISIKFQSSVSNLRDQHVSALNGHLQGATNTKGNST
jgi:hypothetical protein